MIKINNLAVFCGANSGKSAQYTIAAYELANVLVNRNMGLVYGGGNVGIMGAIADAMLERQGKVIGVIPQFLVEKELAHTAITELHIVNSMHERKARMAEMADGFILLPGGAGSLEEFFEIFTWSQLGLHTKPCGILNVDGYYDHLIAFFKNSVDSGFIAPMYIDNLIIENTPENLIKQFINYQPLDIVRHLKSLEQT